MGSMTAGGFRFCNNGNSRVPPLGRHNSDLESPHWTMFLKVNDVIMGATFFNERRRVFPEVCNRQNLMRFSLRHRGSHRRHIGTRFENKRWF